MDWITLVIEIVGLIIMIAWIIIPIQEFRDILRVVRHRQQKAEPAQQERGPSA